MRKFTEFDQCSDCVPKKCIFPCGYRKRGSASSTSSTEEATDQ